MSGNKIMKEMYLEKLIFSEYLDKIGTDYANRVALSQLTETGTWRTLSFKESLDKINKLAKFIHLLTNQCSVGKKIALLGSPSPEWVLFCMAILRTGATVIPLDIKLSPEEISNILEHSECDILFYSEDLTDLTFESTSSDQLKSIDLYYYNSKTIDEIPLRDEVVLPETIESEMNFLVYTSGTSGNPKGVMTSLKAILFQVNRAKALLGTNQPEVFLSMLPMNHLFELTAGIFSTLACGSEVCIARNHEKDHLIQCFQERRVTQMVTVPLFLKSIKDGIELKARQKGKMAAKVFKALTKSSYQLSTAKPLRPWVKQIQEVVFSEIHKQFGGSFWRVIVGSTSLAPDVYQFFESVGIEILEGYGLTETGPIISTNTSTHKSSGSVGKPLPGIQVKIANDNEILTKGPHLMSGYYKNPDLTNETINQDGWLHTGDLGRMNNQGFLTVYGRKKNMIILEGGKKVFPEELEGLYCDDDLIDEVAAVQYSQNNHPKGVGLVIVPKSNETDHAQIVERAKEIGDRIAYHKRPLEFIVSSNPLPRTSTRKIKHHEICLQ